MNPTIRKKLRSAVRSSGILRPRDLVGLGIHRKHLRAGIEEGILESEGLGLYRLSDASPTERHSLALVAKRYPKVVVCLLTALNFHALTTQLPHEVWVAVPQHSWVPTPKVLKLKIVQMGPAAMSEAVETHEIEGVPVRVFSAVKTVVDCFRHRKIVGNDVAIEALRAYLSRRDRNLRTLLRTANTLRIASVIKPYAEALT
ncbi:hypothetical protein ANRL2_04674 [Anaerolineae bacterium]|nr:hypothetical protein ANRL2_04674 [Anaerolineae bacterium]